MDQQTQQKISLDEVDPLLHQKNRKTISTRECGQIKLINETHKCENVHKKLSNRKKNTPVGIPNFGMTCYIGASLQATNNIPQFREAMIRCSEKIVLFDGFEMIKTVGEFGKKYLEQDAKTVLILSKKIKALIARKNDYFKGMGMRDAAEFLETFIILIEKEVRDLDLKSNFVSDVFRFKIKKGCRSICNEVPFNLNDVILKVDVNVPSDEVLTLDRCIHEKLRCSNCGSYSGTWEEVPEAIIFHFPRQLTHGNKENRVVKLSPLMTVDEKNFKLRSIITHLGSDNNGHFVTDLR